MAASNNRLIKIGEWILKIHLDIRTGARFRVSRYYELRDEAAALELAGLPTDPIYPSDGRVQDILTDIDRHITAHQVWRQADQLGSITRSQLVTRLQAERLVIEALGAPQDVVNYGYPRDIRVAFIYSNSVALLKSAASTAHFAFEQVQDKIAFIDAKYGAGTAVTQIDAALALINRGMTRAELVADVNDLRAQATTWRDNVIGGWTWDQLASAIESAIDNEIEDWQETIPAGYSDLLENE